MHTLTCLKYKGFMTNKDGFCPLPRILFSILAKKIGRESEEGERPIFICLCSALNEAPFCQPIPHSFWTPFKSKMYHCKFPSLSIVGKSGQPKSKDPLGRKNGANTWKVSTKGEKNILIICAVHYYYTKYLWFCK